MTARPYQTESHDAVLKAWEEFQRALLVLPTGGGKTIVMAHLAQTLAALGKRVLVLAHRKELILQAVDKFRQAAGLVADVEKAEFRAPLSSRLVVGSVQTFGARGDRWEPDAFDYVFVDEAHHVLADSYQFVLKLFPAAKVLGVTATPHRGDQKNLGEYFDTVAKEVGLFDLINAGYLVPIRVQAVPISIDLSAVRSARGDFDDNQLATALDPYLDQIADAIRTHAVDALGLQRRTLVFVPLIATSHKFVAACRAAGLSAAHVDGQSPDRAAILQRFALGEFQVLSNAMLLTEGYDDPGIACVVPLRATRSQPLYAQMIGRGTRLAEGKEDLLLLDFLWHHQRHRLCRPADLIAKSDTEAEAITSLTQKEAGLPADVAQGLPQDLQELATAAQAEHEERLRKKLEEAAKGKAKTLLSADEFAAVHNRIDLVDWEGRTKWELTDVTPAQDQLLRKARINPASVRGFAHAAKLLEVFRVHRPIHLASEKQRALMRRMHWRSSDGQRGPDEATAGDAAQFFQELNARKRSRGRDREPSLI